MSPIATFIFGVMVGYVVHRSFRGKEGFGLARLGGIVGLLGGTALVGRLPSAAVDIYIFGVALGFFGYVALMRILGERFADFLRDD